MGLFHLGKQKQKKHDPLFYSMGYAEHLSHAFTTLPKQRALLLKAVKLYNEDGIPKAASILSRLLPQCVTPEDHTAVLLFLALCMEEMGDQQGAIHAYRVLLNYDGMNSTALSNLGMLYKRQGAYDLAAQHYQMAAISDPKNAYPLNNLACIYAECCQYMTAVTYGKLALSVKPELYQAAAAVAISYAGLGDEESARHYAQYAVSKGQDGEKLEQAMENRRKVPFHLPDAPPELDRAVIQWCGKTALPSSMLAITHNARTKSRVGGPSLGPAPLDSRGKPMRLLCALFCRELVWLPDFPHEGLLRFYIADDERLGADFSNPTVQRDFRVLYDETFDHLTPGPEPEESDTFPVKGCYPVVCNVARDQAMPMNHYRFPLEFNSHLKALGVATPTLEQWSALEEALGFPSHRAGGYPCLSGQDIRARPEYGKYDTLLLQLLNMDDPDIHIHIKTGGVINFCIPKEKLLARDFSDVLYWWDSE